MNGVLMTVLLVVVSVPCSAYHQVCYMTKWSAQRRGSARFTPDDVDPTLCTHLVYAYGEVRGHQMELVPAESTVEVYQRVHALKSKNPALKTIIAIGGWSFRASRLSVILSTPTTRQQFIQSVLQFFQLFNFNGIDLHFVHPATRRRPPEDKVKFTLLCKEMREAFDMQHKITGTQHYLVVSGPAERKYIDRGYEVRNITRLADFVTLTTFDFHGGWERRTGHQAALFPGKRTSQREAQLNMEWAVNYWLQKGAVRSKLVVGMALYGRGYTLSDPDQNGLGAPTSGPSFPGRQTGQGGLLAYYEVCELLQEGATRHWLRDSQVPYVTLGPEWIGYDDRASLTLKVRWLKKQRLGGWMAWSIDYDDVTGEKCRLGKYPLLNAMVLALRNFGRNQQSLAPPAIAIEETPPDDTYFNNEEFCAYRKDGLYPFPGNCSKYVLCEEETGFVKFCPPDLIYDIEWQTCILNEFALGC